jgi:hypothetical protein
MILEECRHTVSANAGGKIASKGTYDHQKTKKERKAGTGTKDGPTKLDPKARLKGPSLFLFDKKRRGG